MAEGPPSFPPPVARTIDWLQSSFGWWYKHNPPPMPDRFTRREFGFMLWPDKPGPPPFFRHRGYGEKGRFLNYLGWKGPHSVYYSTAYYQKPAEMKMVDKHWLGAELIFDLDADHLAEAEAAKAAGQTMSIEDQLRIVKVQFKHLLDEFIFGDFGIDEKDVFLTFSGGRGYHAHITDPRLMQLDAKGRREIVDFITGKFPSDKGASAPDLTQLLHAERIAQGRQRVETVWRLPKADEPGWPGRLRRKMNQLLQENVFDATESAARAWLLALPGVGQKSVDEFQKKLRDRGELRRQLNVGEREAVILRSSRAPEDALLETGLISSKRDVRYRIAEAALAGLALPLSKGETDEPVTADVKRLIRLPGSLHGKSGLKVVTLRRDELDGFDPFRDAVAFPMDAMRITPRNDNQVTLAGETVRVKAGEETEIPMAHAVWLCSRQQATVMA